MRTGRISDRHRSVRQAKYLMSKLSATFVAILCAGAALGSALHARESLSDAIPLLGFSDFGWFPVSDDFRIQFLVRVQSFRIRHTLISAIKAADSRRTGSPI